MTTPTPLASDDTMASPPSAPIGRGREPIPGYVLMERIGAGGYGEVWKAEAPGGLPKAVKFVYGTLDEAAALRELQALEQIKKVHHPLLLSLERIEIVDGYLVVVSELADSSLKDRFDAYRESGLDGIPRDELLRYLSDAADALDYLYEEHSLQHLDIKPENLLLLGKRVKIADFGLVRDVRMPSDSHGGGLTPLYSSPEVLRGEPSRASDQYSLAIVYQQVLTGELPFAGRTSAQLAAQHHHCKPVLKPLPQPDQAIVARALSKEPSKRFPGCRVLVDNLLRAGIYGSASPQSKTSARTKLNSKTASSAVLGDPRDVRALAKTIPFALENAVTERLPALDLSEQAVNYRPTVFVGLGNTGAQTLMRLHKRLEENLGDLDRIPCLQMLVVDTDPQSLGQATEAGNTAAVRGRDTLVMPLRRTHEYRPRTEQLLQWLGRRWLYNIPRSLSTGGFRPLGRLALVDHCGKLIERLRNAIAIATDPESLAPSTENAGIPFQGGPPRVFVVASTAGGTGSGAALDVAYVVRELLTEQGASDELVYGILAHSTTHNAEKRDLAIANTYALLTELKHLTRVGGHYPGDAAFGLLASYQRDAMFRHTYLVHLGDDLSGAQYQSGIDALAEYLYLNCAAPACAFFDRSRELSDTDGPTGHVTMRTFAIGKSRRCDDGSLDSEVAELCQATIRHWLGQDGLRNGGSADQEELNQAHELSETAVGTPGADIRGIVAGQVTSLDLKLPTLIEHALGVVQSEFGRDLDGRLRQIVDRVRHANRHTAFSAGQHPFEMIDGLLANSGVDGRRPSPPDGLRGVLTGQTARLLAGKTMAARQWLLGLLEAPDIRLDGAWQAAACFAKQLGELESSASQVVQRLADEIAGLKQQAAEGQPDELLLPYGRLRVYEIAHRCVRDAVRAMRLEITAIAEDFQKLHRTLVDVAARFELPGTSTWNEQEPDTGGPHSAEENKSKPSPRLLNSMDRQMRNRFAGTDDSLHSILTGKLRDPNVLHKALRETARVVLRKRSKEAGERSSGHGASREQDLGDMQAWIDGSTPKLMDCGGAKRMLMVVGDPSEIAPIKQRIERASGDDVTAVACPGSDMLLCCEMERIPLDSIAASLIGGRREYAELASRLHTRIDVDWPQD